MEAIALISNILSSIAAGIAIFIFLTGRKKIAAAIGILLNFSFQITLGELRQKLERLNDYSANDPEEKKEISNILHEIIGQMRGNTKIAKHLPELINKVDSLATSKNITEPKKRSLLSEVRESLRGLEAENFDSIKKEKNE